MDICTQHGTDIAFDVRNCPACNEIESLKETISGLEAQIAKLEEDF